MTDSSGACRGFDPLLCRTEISLLRRKVAAMGIPKHCLVQHANPIAERATGRSALRPIILVSFFWFFADGGVDPLGARTRFSPPRWGWGLICELGGALAAEDARGYRASCKDSVFGVTLNVSGKGRDCDCP